MDPDLFGRCFHGFMTSALQKLLTNLHSAEPTDLDIGPGNRPRPSGPGRPPKARSPRTGASSAWRQSESPGAATSLAQPAQALAGDRRPGCIGHIINGEVLIRSDHHIIWENFAVSNRLMVRPSASLSHTSRTQIRTHEINKKQE